MTCIAAVVVVAIATVPTAARADGPNEIRAVTYDEDAAMTRVHVRGAQTPTFTVYKLERPSRVVIDVPRARLAEAMRGHENATIYTPSTWAVSTIAAQQLDDGGQIVRVIVTLARPGRYDVKTDGNEVVVMVTARDPAPVTDAKANQALVVKAQADTEQARKAAATAQAEAERLRKVASEQAARADAAQRAVDEARKSGQQSNAAELARANAEATKAKQDAARAQQLAAAAQAEAERMRGAAEKARQDALADAAKAKQEADVARTEVTRARKEAEDSKVAAQRETDAAKQMKQQAEAAKLGAQRDAEAAKLAAENARQAAAKEATIAKQAAAREAEAARQDLARVRAEAEAAKRDAARIKAEAAATQAAAAKQLDGTSRAKAEAEKARREADAARAEAASTKDLAARTKAEADAARGDAEKARGEAARTKLEADAAQRQADLAKRDAAAKKVEADAAKSDAAKSKDAIARTQAEADAAKRDAATAKADIVRVRGEADAAKAEAQRARAEAEAAKADAETAKTTAAADRKKAEAARSDADRMLRESKQQVTALDAKMQAAQALEDKARAANAAAEAREQVARDAVGKAKQEREAAEQAARLATQRANDSVTKDRQKLDAEARQAEDRLAKARKAADDADARRVAAEGAATTAKKDLQQTRTTLATVEQQRTAAESAASDAARKRGEAEAAASDATRRRSEAETAATEAGKKRKEAEQATVIAAQRRGEAEQQRLVAEGQRKAAEEAARTAKAAADASEQQRVVAEKAASNANATKLSAEKSLDELTTRRLAAEHAASELEARSKAEAKAQAEVAAAKTRKATDDEVAKARTEVARLADERKRAEAELADRRKAVVAQQTETSRLEAMAVQARDTATREETRRAKLAEQRVAEEQELARLKIQRDTAAKVAAQKPAPIIATPVVAKKPTPPPAAVAVVPAKATPNAKVTDVKFRGTDGSGQVDIALSGDAKVTVGEVTATHVELLIDHADLAQKLEKKLDVSRYGSPVRAISTFRDRRTPNRVRLIAELASGATPSIDRDATGVKWRFVATDTVARRTPRTQSLPPPVVGGFGATSTPIAQQSVAQVPSPQGSRRTRVYRGATVDLDIQNAPMQELLRLIADVGRVNIVVPDSINVRVTVRLKRVPWDQALEVVLASHDLWYRREGNLYRIADRKQLDKEDQEAAARVEAARKAETPRPVVLPLDYASATELAPKFRGMVSPNGSIEVDERRNALIINDVAGNREQITRLAESLDIPTPQISIEARIVEARSTFLRQFGIQWGGRATASAAGGNSTGLVFPSSISLLGGNDDAATNRTGVAAPSDFAVNLPAAVGSGEGGALGLSLGSIGGNFALNLRLSALEDSGTVRIISAPKITVLNNKPASITQGVSIPIQVISAAGTNTQFVQADLSLKVTPYVSPRDCQVQMRIEVTKNEPDFVNVGARGDPSILKKEASTTMIVADGDTSVLGGIYTRNSGLAYKKLPFFGDIPVLGWFFKSRRENDDRTEILVFITPKITNKASLTCK
ncbi:MAG: type IV pilus secretin PilQ [Kofleriaceae bacterium]